MAKRKGRTSTAKDDATAAHQNRLKQANDLIRWYQTGRGPAPKVVQSLKRG